MILQEGDMFCIVIDRTDNTGVIQAGKVLDTFNCGSIVSDLGLLDASSGI
jgi:hypothetical protein